VIWQICFSYLSSNERPFVPYMKFTCLPFHLLNATLVFCNAVFSPCAYCVINDVCGLESNFEMCYERDVTVLVLKDHVM
jgi:hypothetical protein